MRLLFASLLLCAGATAANADFQFLQQDNARGTWSAELQHIPTGNPERVLLALPSASRQFSIRSLGSDGAEAPEGYIVREVWLGTIPALEVRHESSTAQRSPLRLRVEATLEEQSGSRVPITDFPALPSFARAVFLNHQQLSEIPLGMPASRRGGGLPAPPGDIRITYDGGDELIRVPLDDLGISAAQVNTVRLVHLDCALRVGGVVGDDLWFRAPRNDTATNQANSVFATVGASLPSPEFVTVDAFPTLSPASLEVSQLRSRTQDLNLIYERSAILTPGSRFVLWRCTSGQTQSRSFPIADVLTSNNLAVNLVLLGLNENAGVNPDHNANVTVAGVALPPLSWDGRTVLSSPHNITLTGPLPPAGVLVQHAVPTGSPGDGTLDLQNLKLVHLTWTGLPRVDASGRCELTLPSGAARLATIGGFPTGTTASDVVLLRVGNCQDGFLPFEATQRLINFNVFPDTTGGVAIEFEVPASGGRYLAQRLDSAASPLVVMEAEVLPAPTLAGIVLHSIFVRKAELAAALAPLAATRNGAVIELDPQAAYNAYSGGQESPEAIVRALKELLEQSAERVPFPSVILAGHGSFDRKNYLGLEAGSHIHPFIEENVPAQGFALENSVDFFFATAIGDDEFEDVRIGRFPAKTPTELTAMVNRAVAFHAVKATLMQTPRDAVFVTDNDPEFVADKPFLFDLWSVTGLPLDEVQIQDASDGSAERTALKAHLEATPGGASIVLYTGHGNLDRWAAENVLTSTAVDSINTTGRWPVMMTFTCFNGYYAFPGSLTVSLSEALLRSTTGGALALVAPGTVDFYPSQRLFAFRTLEALGTLGAGATMGDLFLQGRTAFLLQNETLGITARNYNLFGDPDTALVLGDGWPLGLDWHTLE